MILGMRVRDRFRFMEPTPITAFNTRNEQVQVVLDRVPDTCPICHYRVEPRFRHATLRGENIQGRAQVVYLCTNQKCWNLFIATYERVGSHAVDYPDERFTFQGLAPWNPEVVGFPSEIEQLSPKFIQVFTEARAAQGMGLTNLVGLGMRKALECLIKDFAISAHPVEEPLSIG